MDRPETTRPQVGPPADSWIKTCDFELQFVSTIAVTPISLHQVLSFFGLQDVATRRLVWSLDGSRWHWSRKDRYHLMLHGMEQIRPRKLETCKWDKTSSTTFKQQKKVDIINHQSSPFQEFLGRFSSINRAPWAPLSRDADSSDANFVDPLPNFSGDLIATKDWLNECELFFFWTMFTMFHHISPCLMMSRNVENYISPCFTMKKLLGFSNLQTYTTKGHC